MKPTFTNELSASFMLFLDHEICYNAEGFVNIVSGNLYPSLDPAFNNYTIYQSDYRQWVSDSSVSGLGAIVPNSISNAGAQLNKSDNGLKIDYGMGRVFLDDSFPKNLTNLTASFSRKEFNLFLTAKDETQLLLNDPGYYREFASGLDKSVEPYPLIYVKNFYSENNPFAFGGMDESEYEFRCMILADNAFKLDVINSTLQDSARKNFSVFASSDLPFNMFGDFKSGISQYNYFEYCSQFGRDSVYIDSVKVSKFDEKLNKVIKDGVWGGFIDFKIKCQRFPRG
jgi:hypothetical protein